MKRLRVPLGGAAAAVIVLAVVIAALSGADAQPTVARLDAPPPAAVPVSVSVTEPLAPAAASNAGTGSGAVSAPVHQNGATSGGDPAGPAASGGYARVVVDNSSGSSNAQTGSSEMSNSKDDQTGLTRSDGGDVGSP